MDGRQIASCHWRIMEPSLGPEKNFKRFSLPMNRMTFPLEQFSLTPALSRPPSAVSHLRGSPQDGAACGLENSRNAPCYRGRAGRGRMMVRWFDRANDSSGSCAQCIRKKIEKGSHDRSLFFRIAPDASVFQNSIHENYGSFMRPRHLCCFQFHAFGGTGFGTGAIAV
jgi:hypothetical protein